MLRQAANHISTSCKNSFSFNKKSVHYVWLTIIESSELARILPISFFIMKQPYLIILTIFLNLKTTRLIRKGFNFPTPRVPESNSALGRGPQGVQCFNSAGTICPVSLTLAQTCAKRFLLPTLPWAPKGDLFPSSKRSVISFGLFLRLQI